jgi:hypothetical protein
MRRNRFWIFPSEFGAAAEQRLADIRSVLDQ